MKPWDSSSLPSASGVALLNTDASLSYAVSLDGTTYTVQGTGSAANKTRTINTTLWLFSPFDYAVLGRDYIDLKSGTVVDWYNNDADDFPLQVGTSSTVDGSVSLKSGVIINGDVVVGMGGDPADIIDDQGATIIGDIYPMTK